MRAVGMKIALSVPRNRCQQPTPSRIAPAVSAAARMVWGRVTMKTGLLKSAPKSVSCARPVAPFSV